jgi:hypothetical protein
LTFVSVSDTCLSISLIEGRIPDAICSVERVRCFRAGSQSAPPGAVHNSAMLRLVEF